MQTKEFKSRRNKLLKALDNGSIAVVFSAKRYSHNYPYQQNSDFYYLTGFMEPEAIAVLIPGRANGEFILFNRESDPAKEVWEGKHASQKGACRDFGANRSFAIAEIDKILPNLLTRYYNVYSNTDFEGNFDQRLVSWSKQTRPKPHKLADLGKILHPMRLIKSTSELATIRQAVDITTMAHLRAMKRCAPKMYEFELEAEILHEFTRLGRSQAAFPSIVASGINACTLHYSKNNKQINPGDLVLVDAGARYKNYCADVSRTFPATGKFTRNQRTIYEIVLTAQLETIKQIRPGITWEHLKTKAEEVITAGMLEAKFLRGNLKTLLTQQKFKPFFMHKVGHWLGLDTHDVGDYKINNKWRTLEPGMVLTIEPGIYHKPLRIGVRIEDDILVTKHGYEVLTAKIPKHIAEIEALMKK